MENKVGFIGLGNIGIPMSKRLVTMGYDLTVHNRSKEAQDELVKMGAKGVASNREVAENCTLIISLVRDDTQTEEVIVGKDGIITGIQPGTLIIIGSTVSPGLCQRMAKVMSEKGGSLIDAGVSGGTLRAADGTLTIMVGGDKKDYDRALPILQALGKNVFHLGPVGSGEVAKIVNNMALSINYATTLEALMLAKAAGMDIKRALETMEVSSGNSYAVEHWDRLTARGIETTPGGSMRAMPDNNKDLGLALQLADSLDIVLPIAKCRMTTEINSRVLELLK